MKLDKMLLINAGNDDSISGSSNQGIFPALGVLSLGTIVQKYFPGVAVAVIDGQVVPQEAIIKTVYEEKPDLVGVSVLGASYQNALRIARAAKEAGAVTIFGNDHAAVNAEIILRKRPEVDYISGADVGELAFRRFIEFVMGKKSLAEVPELYYRKSNGNITKNPAAALPAITRDNRYGVLDAVPIPDWTLYDRTHWDTYLNRFRDRKSTRLNSSHSAKSRMPSSA